MRIKNLYLNGYGIYHNQRLTDLPAGLTVFAGKNESGKSTLLHFIRMMFFGPKPRQKNNYPPLRGGSYGGGMDVVLSNGMEYIIKRAGRSMTVTDSGGNVLGVVPHLDWMAGLGRDTYESIFAVDLEELQGLKLLESDDVRGRFFAAGVGLNALSLNNTLSAIDTKLSGLLKRRGEGVINGLLALRDNLRRQLADLEHEDREFGRIQADCREIMARVEDEVRELDEVDSRLLRLTELSKARQPWSQLQILGERAAELDYARNFPADGLIRYENLLTSAAAVADDTAMKRRYLGDLNVQRNRITIDNDILTNAAAIDCLYKERGKLAAELSELSVKQAECEQAEQNFFKNLRELGSDWDEERLEEIDISVGVRQQVREQAAAITAARAEQRQAAERERTAAEKAGAIRGKIEQLLAKLDELGRPLITSDQELSDYESALNTLQTRLAQIESLQTRMDFKNQEKGRIEASLAALERKAVPKLNPIPGFAVPLLSVVIAGVFCYLLVAGFYGTSWGVLCLGGLAVYYLYYVRKTINKEIYNREGQLAVEKTQFMQAIVSIELDIDAINNNLTKLTDQVNVLCGQYYWDNAADLEDLNEISRSLADNRRLYQQWAAVKTRLDEAEQELENCLKTVERETNNKNNSSNKLAELEDGWRRWLSDRLFPVNAQPDGFETVIQAVEAARTAYCHYQSLKSRLEASQLYIETKRAETTKLMAAAKKLDNELEDIAGLDSLYDCLSAVRANQERYDSLTQAIIAAEQELEGLNSRLDNIKQKYSGLLAEAGLNYDGEVNEVAQFRKMAHDYLDWRCNQDQIENHKAALRAIAGSAEKEMALCSELKAMTEAELEAETAKIQLFREKLWSAINDDRDLIGRLKERLEQIRKSGAIDNARVQQVQCNSCLKTAAKEWLTYAICRGMLEETRAVYERERQPGVIREADSLLKLMTGSRYRLITPGGSVQLEDTARKVKGESAWSCGLADQVYLAVRLCLAREFNRSSEPLPIILDDVLVKFDRDRQAGILKVLLETALEQQILLFTCQEQILDILKQIAADPEITANSQYAAYNISDGVINRIAI